jgi:parallel beta-helix repeat protein
MLELSENVTICDNSIYGVFLAFGIRVENASNNVLRHNIINRTQIGLGIYQCSKNNISDNLITYSSTYGLEVSPNYLGVNGIAAHNRIINNTLKYNTYCPGIYIHDAGNNTLINNTLELNKDGIYLYNASYNNITDNQIDNNTEYGVFLEGAHNNSVIWNSIHGNLIGIEEVSCAGNILTPNDRWDRAPSAPELYGCSELVGGRIDLTWYGVFGATIYYIYRNNTPVGQLPASGFYCHAIDQPPTQGVYSYAIAAGNLWSNSSLSNNWTIDTRHPDTPEPIAGFDLSIGLVGILILMANLLWKRREEIHIT